MLRTILKITGTIGLLFLLERAAWPDVLPGSALPEQVSQSLSESPQSPQKASPIPVTAPAEAPTQLGEEAQKITFQFNGMILEGNRIYPTRVLQLLYKDKLKKTISVADLLNIVQSITNFYRNNGYILSRAILPPQHVKDGIVHVLIVEGTIDQVDVSGHPKGAKCLIHAYGNKIKEHPPLQIKQMEKYLLLANEIPSTQVKAVLSPSQKKQGAADLTLVAENKQATGYVSYDNYGTRYIGPQQMTGNVGLHSFVASGDAAQFTYTKTPKGRELTYSDLNYNLPIREEGTRLLIGITRAETHPQFTLRVSQIDGLSKNYYAHLQVPMIRKRDENLTLQTSFNYMDSDVKTLNERLYIDHLRSLGLSAIYNFADRWYGANLITATVRQGLPILGYTYNTNTTALTSRPGGWGKYLKAVLQTSRLQAVRGPMSIYGALNGQWAFQPLLSSEQFTFGGSQLGRGYDVAEIIGDKGMSGSLELRFDLPIEKLLLKRIQPYVFYDAGMIWNIKSSADTPQRDSGTSMGFGTRFFLTKYVSGNLMWTKVLTKKVAAEGLIGDGFRPRVFFSLVAMVD